MTPEPEDITISPTGPLGSRYSVGVVEGPHLGTFGDYDDAKASARDYMDREHYYPNVWYIDDHGGVSLAWT